MEDPRGNKNMNLPTLHQNQMMSSREIAELLESRHDNVKLSIERLTASGTISFTASQETSHEGAGARPVVVYLVNKRDSYIVVAQMSPKFTARLVDRWQELEEKEQKPIANLSDAATLRELLLGYTEQVLQLQATVEAQKPAVAFLSNYVEAKSSKCLSDVAKILNQKPKSFINRLSDDKVIFKRGGVWVPYQNHIDAGRFTVKTGESAGHCYEQTRVEPSGIAWLATKYGEVNGH
jgi:phage regulator Rha-like protein